MNSKVLISHGSKHGATTEIAEKIAEILQTKGLESEVKAAKDVKDLSTHQNVILGVSLYMGQWNKHAVKFLKNHQETLKDKNIWIFSSGPTGKGDPVEMLEGRLMPASLAPMIETINPKGHAVFHGSIDLDKLGFFEKWIINKVNADTGDFRDWDMIVNWADGIAAELV